ncbi:hypothetical protein CR513_39193, partial [Mucuna pruriens]
MQLRRRNASRKTYGGGNGCNGKEREKDRANGGSCVIVACKRLVKKLALPTIVHPRSYRLQWLSKKGELLLNRQVKVMFTLGGYEDRVVSDVVPMEATRLLGRAWEYDKKVIYDGVTNHFTFIHMWQRVVLKPFPPSEVQEDQKKMNVKKQSERKIESKMIKRKSKSDAEKTKARVIKKRKR